MALEVMTFFHHQPLARSFCVSSLQWSNTNRKSDKGTATKAHDKGSDAFHLLLQEEKSRIGRILLHSDRMEGVTTEEQRSAS